MVWLQFKDVRKRNSKYCPHHNKQIQPKKWQ